MAKFILAHHDEKVAEWVAARIPVYEFGRTPYTALGLMNDEGIILAGVIYQNFTHRDIQMHVAALPGRRWLTREFLGECFRYPFEQLDCARVTGMVPSRNADAIRFDEHLGFKLEGCVRGILQNGDDLLIYGMLKRECRFLDIGRHHGFEHTLDGLRRSA